jgi:hypothetical protein
MEVVGIGIPSAVEPVVIVAAPVVVEDEELETSTLLLILKKWLFAKEVRSPSLKRHR